MAYAAEYLPAHEDRSVSEAPPSYAIEAARTAAMQSPCAKSKRGAVLFSRTYENARVRNNVAEPNTLYQAVGQAFISGIGFNGQPEGFTCTGTDACRRDCAKLCMHAEQRALIDVHTSIDASELGDLELVHVKVVDGAVVPGGSPSCWQCSRLVVESGIRGVWLFEKTDCPSATCRMCSGAWCTICGPGDAGTGFYCEHATDERHRGAQPPQGAWHFYTATEFHIATLKLCRLEHNATFVELGERL